MEEAKPDPDRRVGTPEAIAAVEAELEALSARGVMPHETEYRRKWMERIRLLRRVERPPKARLDRERAQRLELAGRKTERATTHLIEVLDALDARPLVLRLLELARTDLVDALARRLKSEPCEHCGQTGKEAMKAEQQLLDLVHKVFSVERAKDPPKKADARPVLVREWPGEAVKG